MENGLVELNLGRWVKIWIPRHLGKRREVQPERTIIHKGMNSGPCPTRMRSLTWPDLWKEAVVIRESWDH